MDVKRFGLSSIPLISFVLFMIVITYLFFLRPPVILVTDIYTHALYGAEREQILIFEASFKIGRQVKVFRIMEETDSYTIAETIKKTKPAPEFVFFPFHYSDAAKIYADQIKQEGNPLTKTLVFFYEETQAKNTDSYISITPDTKLDSYRKGRCAAILSKEIRLSHEENLNINKQINFIYDTQPNNDAQQAFEKGLAASGYFGKVNFVNTRDMVAQDYLDCVVIEGPASLFFQSATGIPVILLSWFNDPIYFPDNVKIQIDDSPYALIPKIVSLPKNGFAAGSVLKVPATFKIIRNKIINKKLIGELSKAIRSDGT
ncbi:MAG: hypothetical protein LBT01_04530 [Spirochaetaceae bacterium]|jgi:hypothetical protein|nr:hypothetical protein [Spirochaetaceae bacterium]